MKWLSRDPLGERGGVNLTQFCGNDPINRVDPLGLADTLATRMQSLLEKRAPGALAELAPYAEATIDPTPDDLKCEDIIVLNGLIKNDGIGPRPPTIAEKIDRVFGAMLDYTDSSKSDEWLRNSSGPILAGAFLEVALWTAAPETKALRVEEALALGSTRGLRAAGSELAVRGGQQLEFGFVAEVGPRSVAAEAAARQGTARYPGIDTWRDIILKQGTVVYAGEPGVSGFFTTRSAIRRAGGDAQTLFEGLQVAPHAGLYRPGVTAFEVIADSPAAFGRAVANPQFNSHGSPILPELFIPDWELRLRPVQTELLRKRAVRIPTE